MQLHQPLNSAKLLLLLSLFAGCASLIMIRLYFIQIVHAPFFAHLARTQYTVSVDMPATRGTLFDRSGTPLALPYQRLSAFVSREHLKDEKATVAFLHDYYPAAHDGLTKKLNQSFFWVTHGLDEKGQHDLHKKCPDLGFLYEPTRWYAQPYAPHVTGFTAPDTRGISGSERFADEVLAGKPQRLRCEPSSIGDGLHHLQRLEEPGRRGSDVFLAFDNTLQFLVEQELATAVQKVGGTRGSALVINPDTGEVLTLSQIPSFDPNTPTKASPADRITHSISSPYEHGSTMMIFAALAALAEDEVSLNELVACDGKRAIIGTVEMRNDTEIHTVPFWQVVADGSNIGMAKISHRLGTRLYNHLQRLGFGSTVGLELPNEQSGYITPPTRWSAASALHLSNGYEVLSTVVQVARALAIIANGGHAITLTLRPQRGAQRGQPLYDTGPIETIRKILRQSAEKNNVQLPGYQTMGHVGSARMLHEGEYSDKHELFTFAGIIASGGFRRVVVANIEGAGSKKALWQLGGELCRVVALHSQ